MHSWGMTFNTPSLFTSLLTGALLSACSTDGTASPTGGNTDAAVANPDAAAGADGGDNAAAASALDEEQNVRVWANSVSALAVYLLFHEELAVSYDQHTYPDTSCPAVDDDGTTLAISGDCTDAEGKRWVGSVTIERSGDGDRELSYSKFGNSGSADDAITKDGIVSVRRVEDALHEFDVNLVHAGEVTTTVEYEGSVEGGYTGPTVWNGSGTSLREGAVSPVGLVAANTVAQMVDGDVCSGQPASGQTTLSNDEHVVVVTYDGASDCDEAQAARYSVDGRDLGALPGIACTLSGAPGRAGWSWSTFGPFALLLAASVRLSSRRSPAQRLES